MLGKAPAPAATSIREQLAAEERDEWQNGNNEIRAFCVNIGQYHLLPIILRSLPPWLCAKSVDLFPRVTQVATVAFYCPGRMGLLCVFTAVNCDVSEPSVTQRAGFSLFVPLNCLQCADVMEQLVGQTGSGSQMTRRGKSCQCWNWTGTNAAFLQPMTHAYVSNDYWISHSGGLPRDGTWWE